MAEQLLSNKMKIKRLVMKEKAEGERLTENGNLPVKVVIDEVDFDDQFNDVVLTCIDIENSLMFDLRINYRDKVDGNWVETPERTEEVNKWLKENLEQDSITELVDNMSQIVAKEITLYYSNSGFVNREDKEFVELFIPKKFTKSLTSQQRGTVTKIIPTPNQIHIVFSYKGEDGYAKSLSLAKYSNRTKTWMLDGDTKNMAHRQMLTMFGTTNLEELVGKEITFDIVKQSVQGVERVFGKNYRCPELASESDKLQDFLDDKQVEKLDDDLTTEYVETNGLKIW